MHNIHCSSRKHTGDTPDTQQQQTEATIYMGSPKLDNILLENDA